MNKLSLVFHQRDFLFNNGLANLYLFLRESGGKVGKSNNTLLLGFSEFTFFPTKVQIISRNMGKLRKKLATEYFARYIIDEANKKQMYFDLSRNKFEEAPGIRIRGSSSGNDAKNAYPKASLEELELTQQDLFLIAKRNNKSLTEEKFKKDYLTDRCKNVRLLSTKKQKTQEFLEYILRIDKRGFCKFCGREDAELMRLDSKIHSLETGSPQFTDLLMESGFICGWCSFIYQLGNRTQNYWDLSSRSYYYFNSPSIVNLITLKQLFKIEESRAELEVGSGENRKVVTTLTNMPLRDIKRWNFEAYNQEDNLLKLLFLLYNKWVVKKEDSGKYRDIFQNTEIYSYQENKGGIKVNFIIYNEIHKMFRFFDKLKKEEMLDCLFSFKGILQSVVNTEKKENKNKREKRYLITKQLAYKILQFQKLRRVYLTAQYKNVKTNSDNPKSLPQSLCDFESAYLDFIGANRMEKETHNLSKIVGEELGRFLASIGEKDLIFSLRTVYNETQLIKFFSDFSFKYLKYQDEDKFKKNFKGFKKDFREAITDIIKLTDRNNWELLRDYLAIYMIQKYSATKFKLVQTKVQK